MTEPADLHTLHTGFRERFLSHEELTAQLRSWADAYPDFVRLESIGLSEEGRDLWLLTIGHHPDEQRPAAWVDGNMHAIELTGSSVALAIAEEVIALHVGQETSALELPAHLHVLLKEVLFYVMPRVSPDGAEAVMNTGRYVRSTPRDRRPNQNHARWISDDIDGDGLSLLMRVEDPAGEFVQSPDVENLLLPRRLEDPGPYYKVYPEGRIENWNGHTIPDPFYLSDNEPDLNRNFPYFWSPEHEQVGAGRYPMSEPESRAIVEFATAHPNIFTWFNLHTFGGCFIRPRNDVSDNKMNQSDLALFRQLAAWSEEFTGYPVVSGYEEFTYEPDKPIHGSLSDYAHRQRGCFAFVCEVWDLFERIGVTETKRFVERYSHVTREQMVKLAEWDREHNEGRVVRPWKAVKHPQLGPVEVGGVDPRYGMWNPPPTELAEACEGLSKVYLRVAAMVPQLEIMAPTIRSLEGGVYEVEVQVRNMGYMSTYGIEAAKGLDFNEPLSGRFESEGCTLLDPNTALQEVGHLQGWGRGRFSGGSALYFQRSRGNSSEARLRWLVRGEGAFTVAVGSCRTGWTRRQATLS